MSEKSENISAPVSAHAPAKKSLVATITSTILWLLSIVLAFVIKPADRLAFVPDLLLLLGFFPLLILWRRGWLTLLFGIFNTFIGFFLLIVRYLPDEKFTGSAALMRDHLIQMHSAWTWLLLGLVALVWGLIGTGVSIVGWFLKQKDKKAKP